MRLDSTDPRTCTRCGVAKVCADFYRSRASADGYARRCKSCRVRAEQDRRYRETHREQRAAYRKAHPRSGPRKPENPDRRRARDAAYREAHREQRRQSRRRWGAANAAKLAEYRRRYESTHVKHRESLAALRMARRCEHPACLIFGPIQLAWATSPHRCWMCGIRLLLSAEPGSPHHVHMDHVMPLSRGGIHCAENLRPACAACNLRKGSAIIAAA